MVKRKSKTSQNLIYRLINPETGTCGEPAFIIDGDTIVRIKTEVS